MADVPFDAWVAEHYEVLWPELYGPKLLDAAVNLLEDLAGGGPALELGIGTGRIAVPLSKRGIRVCGIERSAEMASKIRSHPGSADIAVTIGDFSATQIGESFPLVYLVRNTITNATTEDEQMATFRNAAAHLVPGGRFVIENYIPALRCLQPGENIRVFTSTPNHLGFEEYDFADQIAISHHHWMIDGRAEVRSSRHRYIWPSELDLMAELAGLRLRERWEDWQRTPFTSESNDHISVWEKPN